MASSSTGKKIWEASAGEAVVGTEEREAAVENRTGVWDGRESHDGAIKHDNYRLHRSTFTKVGL